MAAEALYFCLTLVKDLLSFDDQFEVLGQRRSLGRDYFDGACIHGQTLPLVSCDDSLAVQQKE